MNYRGLVSCLRVRLKVQAISAAWKGTQIPFLSKGEIFPWASNPSLGKRGRGDFRGSRPKLYGEFLGHHTRLKRKRQIQDGYACFHRSNSLQLMKNWHLGLEQTKRHFWLISLELQMGQNSHQFSGLSCSLSEGWGWLITRLCFMCGKTSIVSVHQRAFARFRRELFSLLGR